MATTYTLKFKQFKLLNEYDDGTNPVMNDVIKDVHWRMHAITDDPTPIEVEAYGSVTLPDPTYGSFIPRASVTPSDVQTWFSALTNEEGDNLLTSIKAGLDARIVAKQTPTTALDNPDTAFTDGVSV